MINGKSKHISVPTKLTERQKSLLSDAKLGTMRIVTKNHMLMAQIIYDVVEPELKLDENDRKNKYVRRHYAYLHKKTTELQKDESYETYQR